MAPTTETMLFDMIAENARNSTHERRELSCDFRRSLDALRADFRAFALLLILVNAALSGVQVYLQWGTATIALTPKQIDKVTP